MSAPTRLERRPHRRTLDAKHDKATRPRRFESRGLPAALTNSNPSCAQFTPCHGDVYRQRYSRGRADGTDTRSEHSSSDTVQRTLRWDSSQSSNRKDATRAPPPRRSVDQHEDQKMEERRRSFEMKAGRVRSLAAKLARSRMTATGLSMSPGPVMTLLLCLTQRQINAQLRQQERSITRLEASRRGDLTGRQIDALLLELGYVTQRTAPAPLSPGTASPRRTAATGRNMLERMEASLLGIPANVTGEEEEDSGWNQLEEVARRVEAAAEQVESFARKTAAGASIACPSTGGESDVAEGMPSQTTPQEVARVSPIKTATVDKQEAVTASQAATMALHSAQQETAIATPRACLHASMEAAHAIPLANQAQEKFRGVEMLMHELDVRLKRGKRAAAKEVQAFHVEALLPEQEAHESPPLRPDRTKAAELLSQVFSLVAGAVSGRLNEAGTKAFLRLVGCDPCHLDHTWSELQRTHHGESSEFVLEDEAVGFMLANEDIDADGCFEDQSHEEQIQTHIAKYNLMANLISSLLDVVDAGGTG